jgi:sarcosine oxidase
MAVLQPEGGFLAPERCIVCHLRLAQDQGAEIRVSEKLLDWEPLSNGVRVKTDRSTFEAEHIVIAAGSWISKLVNNLAGVTVPERQVLAWFQPHRPEYFDPGCFPVFNVAVEEGRYYGLPVFSVPGFKLGRYHHLGQSVDPDQCDRKCHASDEQLLRSFASRYFPDGAGPTMNLKTCMFTNTPDEHFILDLHPQYPQVAIASPCSGHGFKFCSVIGEIMADLVLDGTTRHDIAMHRMQRFRIPSEGSPSSLTPIL